MEEDRIVMLVMVDEEFRPLPEPPGERVAAVIIASPAAVEIDTPAMRDEATARLAAFAALKGRVLVGPLICDGDIGPALDVPGGPPLNVPADVDIRFIRYRSSTICR